MKRITIGIDIGGTNSKYGLVDEDGRIIRKGSVPTGQQEDIEDYVAYLCKTIKEDTPKDLEITGVGVGAPNANYYTGTIEYAPNLRWKGVIPLVALFKNHYDLPIALTNDANAAALGEMIYGAAKGFRDFIVITLGTGVGSGIVVDGDLVYGHDGFAGELGHSIVFPEGRPCTCGRRGCLEAYASARGIKQTVVELLNASDRPSPLRKIDSDDLTPKNIYEAAKTDDPIALEAFEYTGRILGFKMADAATYTSPAAIFFFGGVARAGEILLEPTKRHMEANILNIYKNKIKLIPSGLPDSDAAILGSSALIRQELAKLTRGRSRT